MNNKFSDDISKLLKSIGLLALFIGVIWGVNIVVDPANIAGSGYARDVAQIMISGKNVTNIQNLDDRELIEEYVELFNEPLDVLVLGSSRSMQITPQLTGVEKTFCAGVTGADLRDSISTYLLFKEKGILPQKVIFCAEYWFLSSGNLDSRALTEKYYEFCDLTGNIPYKSDSKVKTKIKELISFSYFQSSVEFLLSGKNAALEATDQKDNTLATRRYDGSYSYDQEYREGGVEQSDKYAEESTIANLLAVYFSGIDVNLKKQTEDFIEMMIDDGVTVEIQLAPFHPIYYNHMTVTESFKDILSTEEYYYSLAEKYDIKCYGSYNPEKFGMTSIDFYDAQHPTAEGIYKYYGKLITSNSEAN